MGAVVGSGVGTLVCVGDGGSVGTRVSVGKAVGAGSSTGEPQLASKMMMRIIDVMSGIERMAAPIL